MRLIGILALLIGVAGAGYGTWAAFHARRPLDLAWALLTPVAVLAGVVGLITTIFPEFL